MPDNPSASQTVQALDDLASGFIIVKVGDDFLRGFRTWLDAEHPDWHGAQIEVAMPVDAPRGIQLGTLKMWSDTHGWRIEREIKALTGTRWRP
jgi:hypothetical protein